MSRRRDARGFTLIEVLVAFAILVVLMLPLSRSFSLGMLSAERTDSMTGATLLAQSALETLGHAVPLVDDTDVERQDGRYLVSATVRRYRGPGWSLAESSRTVPYNLAVMVRWQEGARTRSLTLHTIELGPPTIPAAQP